VARIFLGLSLFAVGLLITNIVVGLLTGDFNGMSLEHREAYRRLAKAQKGDDDAEIEAARSHFDQVAAAYEPLKKHKVFHFLLGLLAALVTVLVNSITVTYFIGTSRWCREVCDAYGLGDELPDRCNAIKRQAFPWSAMGIVVMLAIIVLGAAADPSSDIRASASWVGAHYLGAVGGTCAIALAFFMQISKIGANYEVIEEILNHVRRIRTERGLDPPTNDPAEEKAPAENP